MASLVSFVIAGTTWCFCTALGSLVGACCGNDKPSTVAPGAASGRKRSVLLLVMAIAIAFIYQYAIAGPIATFRYANYLTDAWLEGCLEYTESELLVERCAGYAGVYRSAFSALVFYILAAIGVACKRTANREAWPAKYVLFLFLVGGMVFVPNDPLFLSIYLNIARVGGVIFIIIQQVIFVDLAFNWNDSWVERSNAAEQEEMGSGKKWLYAIVISAIVLILGSIAGWVILFVFFGGCSTNNLFISVTIVYCILIFAAQLSGEEGSLLSSSIITAYATSLCYSAVVKNPDETCNPLLGEDDIVGILIGVSLTVISLGYAGWSTTADKTLSGTRDEDEPETEARDEETTKVTGVVANDYGTGNNAADEEQASSTPAPSADAEEENVPNNFSNSWKLNLVLGVVSCWFSMAITAWGSIQSGGFAANPQVGEISMWMIIASQWLALTLYLWTLVAPRLFPDRDFS